MGVGGAEADHNWALCENELSQSARGWRAQGTAKDRTISLTSRRRSQNADTISEVTSLRISQQLADDPLAMWRQYARSYPRTIRDYDFGAPGDPDLLTEAEAWRSRIINSRLTRSECRQGCGVLWPRRGTVSRPTPTSPTPIRPNQTGCSRTLHDCTGLLRGRSASLGSP